LGPAGGVAGGRLIATGTPEAVARHAKSITGPYLAAVLGREPAKPPVRRASRSRALDAAP
ncbi:MAG TPA: hypothetical protein VFV94_16655, partial [Polyangiaceae bacterium]|nr:hypothetical protein [Polyangiaceae bacterium]